MRYFIFFLLLVHSFLTSAQTSEYPCSEPPYYTLVDPLYANSPTPQMQIAQFVIGLFLQLGGRQSRTEYGNEGANDRVSIQTEYFNNVETIVITPGVLKNNKKIIYFHGGAYTDELILFQLEMAIDIAKRAGSSLYLVQYRLVPEHLFPAPIEDGMSVYLKLLESFNADEIVFMGDSAGGGLALGLAGKLRDDHLPLPAQLVLIAPWLDVECDNPEMPALDDLDPMLSVDGLGQSGINYVGHNNLSELDNPYASPLLLEGLGDLPPSLLFIGKNEILYPDALLFKNKALAQNMDLTFIEVNGGFHVWLAAPAWLVPESAKARNQIASFINCHVVEERIISSEHNSLEFTLFPNPSAGNTTLKFNSNILNTADFTEFEINIADVNGQVLYQNSIQLDQNSFRFTIPIELKSGIYIVNVQNAKNEGIQTLVISQ
jgi:monoterpene epsilon-lactone hydrolase